MVIRTLVYAGSRGPRSRKNNDPSIFPAKKAQIEGMADIPESKSALKRMAKRYKSSMARRRREGRERSERMWEGIGAAALLPVVKQVTTDFDLPFLSGMELDEKLQAAAICYGVSMFTSGRMSDAFYGASIGAIGAFSWEGEGLLAGLFGPSNNGG